VLVQVTRATLAMLVQVTRRTLYVAGDHIANRVKRAESRERDLQEQGGESLTQSEGRADPSELEASYASSGSGI
jgi:hypothetical protein